MHFKVICGIFLNYSDDDDGGEGKNGRAGIINNEKIYIINVKICQKFEVSAKHTRKF
jgi:hypothetical protein